MTKLIEFVRRCIIRHRQRKGELMKTIILSNEDAAQIKAILETHAEMADNQALPSMELIGRMRLELSKGDDDEVQSMIVSLEEQVNDFEVDSENLKRLSLLF